MSRNRTSLARTGPWWLRGSRRIPITALLIVLCLVLARSLFAPFDHPRTHLVLLTGGGQPSHDDGAGPARYVLEDFAAFLPLESQLYRGPWGPGLSIWGQLRGLDELRVLGEQFAALPTGTKDVLIVYVHAQGVSDDGTPYLAAAAGGSPAGSEVRFPLRAFLRQLQSSTAGHILLILDAGSRNYDPARGMLVNQFPRLLRREVERLADPRLAVLCSHDQQQHSHLSHSLRRSVFGYFVAEGLQGAADENGDRVVTLDELHRYVTRNVSAWIEQGTGGMDSQTPFLLTSLDPARRHGVPLIAVPASGPRRPADQHQWLAERNRRETRFPDRVVGAPQREAARLVRAQIDRVRPRSRIGSMAASHAPQFWSEVGFWFGGSGSGLTESNDLAAPDSASETGPAAAKESADLSPDPAAVSGTARDNAAGPSAPAAETQLATSPDGASPEVDPSEFAGLPLEAIFHELWLLRDRLEARPVHGSRPHDYAPHVWRAWQQQLLDWEQQFLTGPEETHSQLRQTLTTQLGLLRAVAADQLTGDADSSELLRRLAAARPERLVRWPAVPSLALQELTAQRQNRPLPEDLQAVRALYDGWLQGASKTEFFQQRSEFLAQLHNVAEFRFAAAVSDRDDLDWDTLQLALRVSREAEQTVVHAWRFAEWLQPRWRQADQLRMNAERSLLDGIARDASSDRRLWHEAEWAYQRCAQDARNLEQAYRLKNDLLLRLPAYLEWYQQAAPGAAPSPLPGPRFDQLQVLLTDLHQLCEQLDHPLPERLEEALALAQRLARQREQIEQPLSAEFLRPLTTLPAQPGDAWQIELLLQTPLPSAPARRQLRQALRDVEGQWVEQFVLPSPITGPVPQRLATPEDWQRMQELAELQSLLTQFGRLAEREPTPQFRAMAYAMSRLEVARHHLQVRVQEQTPATAGEARIWETWSELSGHLQNLYQNLPGRLEAVLKHRADGQVDEVGTRVESEIRLALRLLAWIDPRDVWRFQLTSPGSIEERRAMRRFLAAQQQRALIARMAGDQYDTPYWTGLARQYAAADSGTPGEGGVAMSGLPPVTISDTGSLALTLSREVTIPIRMQNRQADTFPVWLLLEWDEALLDVSVQLPGVAWYRAAEWPPAAAREAAARRRFPLPGAEPGDTELHETRPPSFALHPGRPETLPLRVQRRTTSRYPTRIVVTAVTEFDVQRRSIPVTVPAPRDVDLMIAGVSGTWGGSGEHWTLHPFPNRGTPFGFSLRSDDARHRSVDVILYAPRESLPPGFPRETLGQEDADQWLRTVALGAPLAAASGVVLPETGQWVEIPLAEPEPAADSPDGEVPPVAADAAREVGESLLCVVTDNESRQRTLIRFEVAPQRPARFVRPRVSYDPDRGRLEIHVLPLDWRFMPPGAVQVRAEIHPLPDEGERRLDARLAPPDYRGTMYAEIPPEPGKQVTVQVHVDGYPRAFLYQVPCQARNLDVPSDDERLHVEVLGLPLGTTYSAPAGTFPVQLRVDVPRGAFQGEGDFIEVGIDRRRVREFSGEPTVRIRSDRQARVTVSELGPQGQLVLNTQVTDLQVPLTDVSPRSGRANVLARARVGGEEVWSEPVEIVLDGKEPQFRTVEILSDMPLTIGEELRVATRVDDELLSGVARVNAAIDRDRSGRFPEEGVVEAELDASGAWVAAIPTGGLERGVYNVLLQATDRRGNASEVRRVRVRILTEEELRPEGDTGGVELRGTVLFGRRPQAALLVTLERLPKEEETPAASPSGRDEPPAAPAVQTRTDEEGGFLFRALEAGKYRLRAAGVVFNKPRSAETVIDVAPPQIPTPVELRLP
jgi:hypothetical protein